MGAPLQNPTQAELDFSQAFVLARNDISDGAERQKAFERFARSGLPTRRVESWHYTDLRAKLRQAPPLAVPRMLRQEPARGRRWKRSPRKKR